MPDQAEVTLWARRIARGYAASSTFPISPTDELDLAAHLDEPLENCIMLAISPSAWGSDFINPALDRWEVMTHHRRGRRLGAVNYALGSLVME